MDTGSEHVPGSFCWLSLVTPDPKASADFYGEVFGVTVLDNDLFTTLWQDGELLGSIVNRSLDKRSRDQPPNWMPFVRVLDVERVLARAVDLGGQVWFPPFDTPSARVGLIKGLTGEILGMWQSPIQDRDPMFGAGVATWYELVTPDPEAAKRFYKALFGWRFTNEGAYTVLTNGAQPIGGVVKLQGDWEDHAFLDAIGEARGEKWEVPPHWMTFFKVRDCEETLRKAEALGARVMNRPDDLHTFGQFATIRDPQGVYLSILSRM